MSIPDHIVRAAAIGLRKNRMERTGAGKAFDPAVDPTQAELDDTRAVIVASGATELVAGLKRFAGLAAVLDKMHGLARESLHTFTTRQGEWTLRLSDTQEADRLVAIWTEGDHGKVLKPSVALDRDGIAEILKRIAAEGMPHPRHLDAALDAIQACASVEMP